MRSREATSALEKIIKQSECFLEIIIFFKNLLIGNHKVPKIAAKIATITPMVAAIAPPPIPGPRYA